LALGISIVADILDFLAAPIFGVPIIGDVFDVIVTGLLYLITRSKVSVVMNLAEFIPFLGDFLPVYTVSTILWIARDQEFDKLLLIKKIFNLFSNKQNNI
jgi:type IV secretory pathway VirB3-like protein